MQWAPTQKPVGNYVWQWTSIYRQTNPKKCLGSLGDVCQPPREVQLRGAGPAEITTVRDELHQETLPWSFTLWHCTSLWSVSYSKNVAWPKADSGALMVSLKLVFEDTESKINSPPCVAPAAWMKGWRKIRKWAAPSSCVHGAKERSIGRRQEENTRMKLNPTSFIGFRGHSLVWGNVLLLDYMFG